MVLTRKFLLKATLASLFLITILVFIGGRACQNRLDYRKQQPYSLPNDGYKCNTVSENLSSVVKLDEMANTQFDFSEESIKNAPVSHLRIWHMYAWRDFRYDKVTFFKTVRDLDSDWSIWLVENFLYCTEDVSVVQNLVINSIALTVNNIRFVDPALHNEIIYSINGYKHKLYTDESLYLLLETMKKTLDKHYEFHRDRFYGAMLDSRFSYTYNLAWRYYHDWTDRGIGNRFEELEMLELGFTFGFIESSLANLMYFSRYGAFSFGGEPDCPIFIMAAVNNEVREKILQEFVGRIYALYEGGFTIYREYLYMLTDSSRVFDPVTQDVFDRASQVLKKYGLQ